MKAISTMALLALAAAGQQPAPRSPARPQPRPAAVSKPPAQPPADPAALRFPPLEPVAVPRIESATLPNGLRLYLLEDRELPLVNGLALVRTGNLFDPPDKIGLASMTGIVLRSGGTKARTGDELDEQLENIAAAVESGIGETFGSVSFSALTQNTDEVLQVFYELLTAPEFRQDKIGLVKAQLRSAISRRNDNAAAIAQREFASLLYGRDTPYGAVMEYDHVERIAREDLLAFYRRYYFPANIMLAIRGDFAAAEMRAKIEKLFGAWSHTQPSAPAFPKVEPRATPGLYLAEKKDVTQTFFAMGHLGGTLREKDFPALQVMADILGGGFGSRLFQRVRTSMAAAYAISAAWEAEYNHPGRFEISGSTKSISTFQAIAAIREELERLRTAEVTAEELEFARQRVLNSFVFNFDTKAKTLNRLLTYEYYGYPKDFIEQFQKAVAAVSAADILRVAKDRLRPDRLVVVAVGRPEDLGRQPATLELPVTSLDVTIPEPRPVRAPSDPESLRRGKELLQKAQRAAGGAEKLESIKDAVEVAEFDIDPAFGGMKVKQTDRWIAPGYFRQDSQFPFGLIAAFWDGKAGWLSTPQGAGALPELQKKQVQSELFRMFHRLLLSDRIPERVVNYAGGETVEISDAAGNFARMAIDGQTGLPRGVSYLAAQRTGVPEPVEEAFEEYMEVEGLKMPSRVSITQSGRRFGDVRVLEYRFNSGLRLNEIAKRP